MNIKITNKFIEIQNSISDWFIIFVTNNKGSGFWKYVCIDCVTDLSRNMLGKSI